MKPKLGYIGPGLMGKPMVLRLLAAGHGAAFEALAPALSSTAVRIPAGVTCPGSLDQS